MLKKSILLIILAALMLTLSACAPGANEYVRTENARGQVAGFWLGLWHGIISPITFIVSLFSQNVGIYEVHNNGDWYNFGFMVGVTIIFGGGGGGSSRAYKRKR
jgi:hypothetical protein